MRTLIQGGTVVTAVDTYEADVAIVDGKIAEEWTVWDALGLLQQVGAAPVPA